MSHEESIQEYTWKRDAARFAFEREQELVRPFFLLRPKVFPDGNQWCVLYGDNLQEGVAGFGDTPHAASHDFDTKWYNQKLAVGKQ